MKKAVSDATPLIHLAKIGKISFLEKLFDKIYIPREIFNEVIAKGKELNRKEVILLEKLIDKKFIEVKDIASELMIPNLHLGEIKCLGLCRKLNLKNLLIDDKEGYDAAKLFSLNPLRTTGLLLILNNKNAISFEEFKKALIELSESGYFLSAETYNKLLEAGKFRNRG